MTWQLTIDCNHPPTMVAFWAPVLDYQVAPPPDGFQTWNDWYRSFGVPDEELDLDGDGSDRIIDPNGNGPRIWFQKVPEAKAGKNRLHLDVFVTAPDDSASVRRSVVDQAAEDLCNKGASVVEVFDDQASGHYHVVLGDPEGNEFCLV